MALENKRIDNPSSEDGFLESQPDTRVNSSLDRLIAKELSDEIGRETVAQLVDDGGGKETLMTLGLGERTAKWYITDLRRRIRECLGEP